MPNILLVEDIADNASLVKRVLHSQGYTVFWAETAEAGLSVAQRESLDLILLDLGLPDIDGQTLVGYLRELPGLETIPIIVVTAWPEETARMMVSAYGCNGFISKPINVRAFIDMVNSFLVGKQPHVETRP
jgi:two-component system, cell cycle response regulator DivK